MPNRNPLVRKRAARSTWGRWIGIIPPYLIRGGGLRSDAPVEQLTEALGTGTDDLDFRLYCISKGHALLRAAFLDHEPAIGRGTAREAPTRLDTIRGLQWRLVMSVAGMERFLRGRVGHDKRTRELATIAEALVQSPAPQLKGMPNATSGRRPDLQELFEVPSQQGRSSEQQLARFLGLRSFDEAALLAWLEGRHAASWSSHVSLAVALRNCTAHGALSAKKAQRLHLRPAFGGLPEILFDFTQRTLEPVLERLESAGSEA